MNEEIANKLVESFIPMAEALVKEVDSRLDCIFCITSDGYAQLYGEGFYLKRDKDGEWNALSGNN